MNDPLSLKLAALADPTRRAIVARLALGEATVSELQKPFGISQPAVSKHLKVLEAAGLIERGQAGQSRPRRLRGEALGETIAWVQQVQALWQDSFDRLDALLRSEDQQEEG
ncbi:transcriptional regulator, ArsR family [Acetobacteraceae bacterium AT-5844]|nr:transcriptional regulator, ArsR family [Acetobacteraceae bacterium AT-5844]